nr:putative ribonuclease H-like domain-containing protein [Tanacetum cinerariifolium]
MIIETSHVDFDELTATASGQFSSGPMPKILTPRTNSLGLVLNIPSSTLKAFRVFNSRTRIVEENLHIMFSESTHNVVGSGPYWLFDIDALTRTINYEPIVAGTQSNGFEDPKSSYDDGCKPSSDDGKKVDEDLRKENMPALEDISIFNFSSDDHEDDGAEADMNNLDTTIQVSPTPTTRIHKDHHLDQVIRDLHSATQIRKMLKNLEEHGFEEPIKVIHALKDPSWIEAMQEELLQFKLLLAYASFKGFVVYQMDVKSAFLYEKIAKEVYVCQTPGFEDSNFPDRVYKVEKALYGLHQAPRAWHKGDILLVQVYVDDIIFGSTKKELCIAFKKLMHEKFQMSSIGVLTFFLGLQVKQKKDAIFISQDKYVAKILKKFEFTEVKIASTPMETQKPLLKDEDGVEVDVHMYRYQVYPKVSHLHDVKRIFRYLKGQPKFGLWYPKDSPFDLVAYTDSDYAGASLDRKYIT